MAKNNRKISSSKENTPNFFKCPYCFRNIMPNGVAFRSMTAYTHQDLEEFEAEELEKKSLYAMATDELYESFWNLYPGSKPESTEQYQTYEKNPVLSPLDDRYVTNARFKDGSQLTFKTDADGFTNEVIDTEGRSSQIRICPHCHNRLPFEFGKYPIKYISVVGITSSGKTVFLSQLLSNIQEFLVNVNMTVAGLCPEVDDFVRTHAIRRGKNLPGGNATNVLTRPLPINVRKNDTGERITLVFYDIAGENCVLPEQMKKYGQFIKNADGIIMVVDPRQFPDLIFLTDEDEEEMEEAYNPDRVVRAMYDSFITADFQSGECKIPLAATISKSDLLKDCQYIEESSNIFKNIVYQEYNGQKGFPYNDWSNIDAEVKLLVGKSRKGKLLNETLKQFFSKYSYFAVSALNGKPIVLKEGNSKRYQMEHLPEIIRIEEPLYWILYQIGVIKQIRKGQIRKEQRKEEQRQEEITPRTRSSFLFFGRNRT